MSGAWRLLPCLGMRNGTWRHGGGAEGLWSEKRSVLRCPMQRTALPLAARCNYGCSALYLKSGSNADCWGMGPASFSHRFPLLLSSLSAPSPILFHFSSHRFPLLLPSLSAPSPISFRSFSHRFPLLLSSLSASSLISFRFFSHLFPLLLPSLSAPSPIAFRFFSHLSPNLLSSLSISSPILFRFFFHSFPFLLPLRSARLCPALPPSSYCMAKPCRPWCHAGLCCIVRPVSAFVRCGTA